MKRITALLALMIVIAGFAVTQAAAQARAGATMYIAVQTAALKSGTGWFASARGSLKYGDRVTVLRTSGKYAEVQSYANPSLTGWVPEANLTSRQVVASSGANVSASETAMAGKGFSAEVEAEYRNQNRTLNYNDVDRVENITVNDNDLRRFLEEGRLNMGD